MCPQETAEQQNLCRVLTSSRDCSCSFTSIDIARCFPETASSSRTAATEKWVLTLEKTERSLARCFAAMPTWVVTAPNAVIAVIFTLCISVIGLNCTAMRGAQDDKGVIRPLRSPPELASQDTERVTGYPSIIRQGGADN